MCRQLVGWVLLPSMKTRTFVDSFHKTGKFWWDNLRLTVCLRRGEDIKNKTETSLSATDLDFGPEAWTEDKMSEGPWSGCVID
jgi:hypothetical protein